MMVARVDRITEFRPDLAIPPGDHIKELLGERSWTQRQLAEWMGRPDQVINEIINGKRAVTAETALQLEDVLAFQLRHR
jgi:HTH-type transcriptional regulator/antitoxin HigA